MPADQATLPESKSIAGWSIRYKVYNTTQASTIVFVHGTPWSSRVFVPIAEALAASQQRRIILYDLAGYGESQSHSPDMSSTTDQHGFVGDTSVKAQASILSTLLGIFQVDGKNGNSRAAVIAHDIAGTIALRAHLLHGCEFESLLLWDTNCVLPWGDGFYKLARSKPATFLELPNHIFEAVLRSVVQSALHKSPRELGTAWEDGLASPWLKASVSDETSSSERQRNFVQQIAQANDSDVAEMLDQNLYAKVRCDVKILWGENDQWIPRNKLEELGKLLGHRFKGLVAIPNAGHLVMLDQPERVTAETLSWLLQTHDT